MILAGGGRDPGGLRAREAPTRGRERLLAWGTPALVLAVYGVVQVVFLLGPQPYDPAKYFKTAVDFPDVPPDLWTLRIGLVAPVRAAVLAFGPSEAALYAVPIVVGLVLTAAVYGTMLVLFGDRLAAAAAALATALNAHFLVRSSSIFPDTAATATFTAGLFLLVLGASRADARSGGRASTLCAAGAGVLFGWTYLVREFSPILAVAVVASLALLRYPLRSAALAGGAALATAGLELVYGLLVFGEPLVHARLLLSRDERPLDAAAAAIQTTPGPLGALVDAVTLFPRLLVTWRAGWAFALLVALFVLALVLRRRDRRLWVLAAWCFGFWAIVVVLGAVSLATGEWILRVTNARYWLPLFPPLVMGAFAAVVLLVPRRPVLGVVSFAHAASVTLAALVLVPGFVEFRACGERYGWVNDPGARWHELRSWFATPEAQRYDLLRTDVATERLLPAFTSTRFGRPLWRGAVEALPADRLAAVPAAGSSRSLVLVHRDRYETSDLDRLEALQRGWSPVFVSRDAEIVLLAASETPAETGRPWPSLRREAGAKPGTCGRPYVDAVS